MKLRGWLVLIGIVVAILAGFFIFRGTQPQVILPSEVIFSIGGWDVRNTVFTSWVVIAFLTLMSLICTRKIQLVPVRMAQNFIEAVMEWMLGIVENVAGEANARRFFPIVGTIFLYVICSNWFGLLPIYNTIGLAKTPEVKAGETVHATEYHTVNIAGKPVAFQPFHPRAIDVQANDQGQPRRTDGQGLSNESHSRNTGTLIPFFRSTFSDANAPLSIAIISFFAVEYWGLATLGVGAYLGKFFPFKALARNGPMGAIDIFVGLLELLSEFIRIISFTFRLLGNIFAGEVLIVFMTFLVPFVVPTVFYGLELFVGLIQASVFALLTLIFAIMAVEHHDESGEHGQVELEPA